MKRKLKAFLIIVGFVFLPTTMVFQNCSPAPLSSGPSSLQGSQNTPGETPNPPPPTTNLNCTFYISVNGSSANSGTQNSPWSLGYAFDGANGSIRPGDTVCISGGTYAGRFVGKLNGTASNPIIVRAIPGQRAIIDGGPPIGSLTQATGTHTAYQYDDIYVSDASKIQGVGLIVINNEEMQVAGIVGNKVTVVRGWSGSCGPPPTPCPDHAANAPIKAYQNLFTAKGSYTWYWGLEITNTGHVTRVAQQGKIDMGAAISDECTIGCKFINNIASNGGGGIGTFNNSNGSEYYGNILFYNGWEDTSGGDPGKGHGLYIQNFSPTAPVRLSKDNLSFSNFGFNMQAYTDNGGIHNLHFEGNVFFESSNPVPNGPTFNFLIGGGNTAFVGFKMISNYTYGPTLNGDRRGTDVVGWGGTPCTTPEVKNNYLASGNFELGSNCSNPVMTGNTLYTSFARSSSFPSNTYFTAKPTGANATKIFVRPNFYEPGRGHIIVYNWSRADSVQVDLSSLGLTNGQAFSIKDSQNINGTAVFSSTFNSASPIITLPMTATAVSPLYGTVSKPPHHSDKEFGTFVVIPQ